MFFGVFFELFLVISLIFFVSREVGIKNCFLLVFLVFKYKYEWLKDIYECFFNVYKFLDVIVKKYYVIMLVCNYMFLWLICLIYFWVLLFELLEKLLRGMRYVFYFVFKVEFCYIWGNRWVYIFCLFLY